MKESLDNDPILGPQCCSRVTGRLQMAALSEKHEETKRSSRRYWSPSSLCGSLAAQGSTACSLCLQKRRPFTDISGTLTGHSSMPSTPHPTPRPQAPSRPGQARGRDRPRKKRPRPPAGTDAAWYEKLDYGSSAYNLAAAWGYSDWAAENGSLYEHSHTYALRDTEMDEVFEDVIWEEATYVLEDKDMEERR